MKELITSATTILVTAVGLWFAYNYRLQMTLKLSETRLKAYSRLWEISGVAAPTRLEGWGDDGYLRPDERRALWAAMTNWYYAEGNGMLLTATTKVVYLNVKHNLLCASSKLKPDGLGGEIKKQLPAGQELDDKVRGVLAIRLISLLRTQLKSDLAIYGATFAGRLDKYEGFFLEKSGVDLASKAWAGAAELDTRRQRRHQRRRQRREALAYKAKARPQPSPLQGMSVILNVGETPHMPQSSRIAVSNALSGDGSDKEAQPSQVVVGERAADNAPEGNGG